VSNRALPVSLLARMLFGLMSANNDHEYGKKKERRRHGFVLIDVCSFVSMQYD